MDAFNLQNELDLLRNVLWDQTGFDRSEVERIAAANALGDIGNDFCINALFRQIQDVNDDDTVNAATIRALGWALSNRLSQEETKASYGA